MSPHFAILRFKEREKYVSAYGIPAFSGNWTFKLRVSMHVQKVCGSKIVTSIYSLLDPSSCSIIFMIIDSSESSLVRLDQTNSGRDNMIEIYMHACMGETSGSTCDMLFR